MALYRLINYSISHVCLMCFVLIFTRWKYSARKTIGVGIGVTVVLVILEWLRYVHIHVEAVQQILFSIQIILVLAVSVYLSRYRDFRGLFTGFVGRDYILCGTLLARCLFVSGMNLALSTMIGVTVNLLALAWMIRYLRPHYMEVQLVNRREWMELCLIPAASILARLFLRRFLKEPTLEQVIASLSLMVLLYFCYILIVRLASKISKEDRIRKEHDMLESSIKALKRSMEEVCAAERQIAIQNHDRRHRVRTIQGLMAKGDYDAVNRLLSDYQEVPEISVVSVYCANVPINSVVSSYVASARQQQIRTYISLDIPETLSVNEWELAVVIGNLLENAVYAAGEVGDEERRILWMLAKQVRGQLLIEVLNTYQTPPVFDETTLLPISSRGESHGLGLTSVAYFAEHNGAVFDCGIEDEKFFARLLT